MRRRWSLPTLGACTLVTGFFSVREVWFAPSRGLVSDRDAAGGLPILIHAPLVGALAFLLVARIYRHASLPERIVPWLRIGGWIGLFALLAATWPPTEGAFNASPRLIALAALATLVPVLPALLGALLFDLALVVCRAQEARRFVSPRAPAGAIFCGFLGAALAYAWTGLLGFGAFVDEEGGPMRFEALALPGIFALPLFPVLVLIGIGWGVVASARNTF